MYTVSDDEDGGGGWVSSLFSAFAKSNKKEFIPIEIEHGPLEEKWSVAQFQVLEEEARVNSNETEVHPNVAGFDVIRKFSSHAPLLQRFKVKDKRYWRSLYLKYPYLTIQYVLEVMETTNSPSLLDQLRKENEELKKQIQAQAQEIRVLTQTIERLHVASSPPVK